MLFSGYRVDDIRWADFCESTLEHRPTGMNEIVPPWTRGDFRGVLRRLEGEGKTVALLDVLR